MKKIFDKLFKGNGWLLFLIIILIFGIAHTAIYYGVELLLPEPKM